MKQYATSWDGTAYEIDSEPMVLREDGVLIRDFWSTPASDGWMRKAREVAAERERDSYSQAWPHGTLMATMTWRTYP